MIKIFHKMNDQDLLWDLLKMNDEDLLYVYNHDLLKINDWNFPWDLLCMCVIRFIEDEWLRFSTRWMIKIYCEIYCSLMMRIIMKWNIYNQDSLCIDDENYYEMKYLWSWFIVCWW
jgi:hypothetical protein